MADAKSQFMQWFFDPNNDYLAREVANHLMSRLKEDPTGKTVCEVLSAKAAAPEPDVEPGEEEVQRLANILRRSKNPATIANNLGFILSVVSGKQLEAMVKTFVHFYRAGAASEKEKHPEAEPEPAQSPVTRKRARDAQGAAAD